MLPAVKDCATIRRLEQRRGSHRLGEEHASTRGLMEVELRYLAVTNRLLVSRE
jgi:hypothetical protein